VLGSQALHPMAIHTQGDPLEAAPASSASKGTLPTERRRFHPAISDWSELMRAPCEDHE
jgi:hypothetical protein